MEWLASHLWPESTQFRTATNDGGIGEYDSIASTGLDTSARAVTLTRCFIVEGQLDVRRLKGTAFELVETKFRKLGSRLALINGVYTFQVPRRFSHEVPPLAFTSQHFEGPYCGPALPIRLDDLHGPPFAQTRPEFQAYARSAACPKELDDWLKPNVPCVHIHVTTFDDYTFLGITASHIFFDAGGSHAFISSWLAYLRGDKDSVPVSPWDYSPFSDWAEQAVKRSESNPGHPVGKPPPGRYWLSRWGKLRFIWHLVLRILRDRQELALLFSVPKKWLEEEKERIMGEICEEAKTKDVKCDEYVSSNDVMLAWIYKLSYDHRTDPTPVHVHLIIDPRAIFPSVFALPYFQNVACAAPCPIPPIPASKFSEYSLSQLSRLFRRHLLAGLKDHDGIVEECGDLVAFSHKTPQQFPCPPGAIYEVVSNWRKFGFGQLDFSAALKDGCEGGKVMYVCAYRQDTLKLPTRGSGGCTGEDADTIWLTLVRGKKEWQEVQKLGKLKFLDHNGH